nr:unnamed protein product [Digitaria exilis]
MLVFKSSSRPAAMGRCQLLLALISFSKWQPDLGCGNNAAISHHVFVLTICERRCREDYGLNFVLRALSDQG